MTSSTDFPQLSSERCRRRSADVWTSRIQYESLSSSYFPEDVAQHRDASLNREHAESRRPVTLLREFTHEFIASPIWVTRFEDSDAAPHETIVRDNVDTFTAASPENARVFTFEYDAVYVSIVVCDRFCWWSKAHSQHPRAGIIKSEDLEHFRSKWPIPQF